MVSNEKEKQLYLAAVDYLLELIENVVKSKINDLYSESTDYRNIGAFKAGGDK